MDHPYGLAFAFCLAAVTYALCPQPAFAQAPPEAPADLREREGPSGFDAPDTGTIRKSPDDITRQLEVLDQPREGRLEEPLLSPIFGAWREFSDRLRVQLGLSMSVAYTSFYQRISDSQEENGPREGAVGDLDVFGQWTWPGVDAEMSNWRVGYQAEYRHRQLSSSRPSDLGVSAGSLWGTTSGFSTQDPSMIQLWYQQDLFEGRFKYRLGKMDLSDLVNTGTLASANFFFSNAALSDSPEVAFPDAGLGAAVALTPNDDWYFVAGFTDANADRHEMRFGSFFDDRDYFYAAELGLTPVVANWGQAYYQFAVWHTDGKKAPAGQDRRSGEGFSFRVEQFFGDNVMPFFTYARSSGDAVELRQLLTAGIGFANVAGAQDDVLALGWAWGKPDDRQLDDQYSVEVFYRLQMSENFQMSPHVQWIRNPARNPDEDNIGVFGMRLRLQF